MFETPCGRQGSGRVRIALAHNRDDQAETVPMRMLRGTGIHGIAGMEYVREDGLIRPLLDTPRSEIEAYCEKLGLQPRWDSTNADTYYTRNKLRLEVLPLLEKEFNPNLKEGLARLAANAREDDALLEKLAAQAQVQRAQGAVQEVSAYIGETVQTAQMDGEVSSIYPKVGELVGTGSPIMTISMMDDLWGTFNVREDQLNGMAVGSTITAFVPAFDKEIQMKVYFLKDQGSYAVWKATKANGQYDLKTFEVKARPVEKFDGLRPGMSLIIKN